MISINTAMVSSMMFTKYGALAEKRKKTNG